MKKMEEIFLEDEFEKAISVPVMPLRGLVIFPGSVLHFDISRNRSIKALIASMQHENQFVFVTAQKDPFNTDPKKDDDLYRMGVLAKLLQTVRISDDIVRVVLKGIERAEMSTLIERKGYLSAVVNVCKSVPPESDVKNTAMLNVAKDMFDDYTMFNGRI